MHPVVLSKKTRVFAAAIVAAVLFVPAISSIARADGTQITVDGVTLPEPAISHNGTAYVPMRSTFERLGSEVTFEGQSATATMNGSNLLTATIGSTAATLRGVSQQLDAPVYEEGGRVYIPLTALATIFGAHIAQTANGYDITSAPQRTGFPWWGWALIIVALLALLWMLARRPATIAAPGVQPARNPLVTALLGLIPTLGLEHRMGIASSIMDTFANRGYTTQTFQNAGVDVAAARTGNVDALSGLVQRAATLAPPALRDSIAKYAQSVPSFLTGLSPNIASSLKGMIGA